MRTTTNRIITLGGNVRLMTSLIIPGNVETRKNSPTFVIKEVHLHNLNRFYNEKG